LDNAGLIELPPPQRSTRKPGSGKDKVCLIDHDTKPIEAELNCLKPLRIEIVKGKSETNVFKSYISQYHYLGYDRSVGENMKYMIKSADGMPLGCMMFGSAAWKCKPRDGFIGWSDDEREAGLHFLTNNVRNLIFPWVRAPHLASHALALVTRRLSADWQAKYGHPIFMVETFVEISRFRGVCYMASNWINVGVTTGRGRDSLSMHPTLPIKSIWLYPLRRGFRRKLAGISSEGSYGK
jgi:hypothetical protein